MVMRPWTAYGPFELDKNNSLAWTELFENQTSSTDGLVDAAGVYIIGVVNGGKDRIRYIGMTHEQGFCAEIFAGRNIRDVWDVLSDERSRCVRIWLFAKPKETHSGFAWDHRLRSQSHILETIMIMHARAAGHVLINTKKLRAAEGAAVEGLFGTRSVGAKSKAVRTVAKALAL